MRKAFTITELAIVLTIISIMSVIIIPQMTKAFSESKREIVDIVNNDITAIVYDENDEVVFSGRYEDFDRAGYTVTDVKYKDGMVVLKVKKEEIWNTL